MKKNCIVIMMICLSFISKAQNPDFEWVKQIGEIGSERVDYTTTDANGNIYVLGNFRNTVDFDPGPDTYNLTSIAYTDIYILKLDSNGNFVWAKQIAGSYHEYGHAITTDTEGNVYTTGRFAEVSDFDPGPDVYNLTSEGFLFEDIFIQKLDADGNFLWAKAMGGSETDEGYSITTDSAGNVYTTGYFNDEVDFDPGPDVYMLSPDGSHSATFIQKLDTDGNFVWAKAMEGEGGIYAGHLITDANGNVYTTGYFLETADLDPSEGVYNLMTDEVDEFIQKLDTDGNFLWAIQTQGDAFSPGHPITIDANGNVYKVGRFSGTADFDPGEGVYNLTAEGNFDAFIQKLDTNGNLLWAKNYGGGTMSAVKYIDIDPNGDLYTMGRFSDTIDFDPGPNTYNLISEGNENVFIQKIGNNGNFLWAENYGRNSSSTEITPRGLTVDTNGNIYTTGQFNGTVNFTLDSSVQNLTSAGSRDVFIHKLSQCLSGIGIDTQVACNDYTWIDGNTYTENNNTATFNIANGTIDGCDSLVTLDLTINSVSDITTSINGSIITANNNNATYRWLDCDNNYAPLTGETNQNFSPEISGNYAVELTENGCVDTSACVVITTVGLFDNFSEDKFDISPNPTTGNFTVEFDNIQNNLTVRLLSVSGQLIENKKILNTNIIQMKINAPKGVYIIEILDDSGNKTALRLLKV